MRKFLLIDDDVTRVENYEELFNFVEIEYLSDANTPINNNYDGYILDVVLDGRNSNSNHYKDKSFEYFLKIIPSNKPIFIVSSRWEEVMNGESMRILVQSEKYKNVLGYFSWELILNDDNSKSIYRNFAKTQLNNFEGIRIKDFAENDDITILQISDLEFGNPNMLGYIETYRSEIIESLRRDLEILTNDKNKVDLIIICGDIAHQGKTEEYDKAIKWLDEFCAQTLRENTKDNIILVLGNHDFNIDSTLNNYYTYDFSSKEIKKRDKVESTFTDNGFNNFYKFVYDFTGDSKLYLHPKHYNINYSLKDANIVILQLFPVCYDPLKQQFKYELKDEEITEIQREFEHVSQDTTCIIASHVSYSVINSLDPTSGRTNHQIKQMVDMINAKLWLYGHAHDETDIDDVKIGSKKVIVANSDSLLLNSVARCEHSKGGYTLLNLKRKDGQIVAVEYLSGKEIKSIESPFENNR